MSQQAELKIPVETFGLEDQFVHVDDIVVEGHLPEPPDDLVNSIQDYGVLEPVLLDMAMVIIEGRRRYAAARKLGLTEIPARIVVSSEGDGQIDRATASRLALTSHATRHDNIISELHAIERLMDAGYSEQAIVRMTGMNTSTFRQRLTLRNLVPDLRARFEAGQIAPGVALQAAKLDPGTQRHLLEIAGDDKVTGALVKEAKERRSEDVYAALDIPGFEDLPTFDEIAADTLVVRRSLVTEAWKALHAGEALQAIKILETILPELQQPAGQADA